MRRLAALAAAAAFVLALGATQPKAAASWSTRWPTGPVVDQHGLARPMACDIGAYRAQAPTASQTPPPTGGIAIPIDPVSAPYLALGILGVVGILLVARRRRTRCPGIAPRRPLPTGSAYVPS